MAILNMLQLLNNIPFLDKIPSGILHIFTIIVCIGLLIIVQNQLAPIGEMRETFLAAAGAAFGIGGGSKARANVEIDTTIENRMLREIVNETVTKHISAVSQEQLLRIENTGGNVVIEDINMKMDAKIDLESVQKDVNQQEMVSKLTQMLDQAVGVETMAETGFLGGLFGGAATSETNLNVKTHLVNEMTTKLKDSVVSECIGNVAQTQILEIKDTKGDVILKGVNMEMIAETFVKCFSEKIRKLLIEESNNLELVQDINAGSTAKQKGIESVVDAILGPLSALFGSFKYIIFAVIILAVLGALGAGTYFLYTQFSGNGEQGLEQGFEGGTMGGFEEGGYGMEEGGYGFEE